jgi:hypothetical protein
MLQNYQLRQKQKSHTKIATGVKAVRPWFQQSSTEKQVNQRAGMQQQWVTNVAAIEQ